MTAASSVPFHGFEYDVTGRCVATPYAPAPGSARLRVFETREIEGLVFAWHGGGGRPPQWDLPAPAAGTDWSDMEFWSVRFAGHPQETTENSVDLAHLRYVHGYDSVTGVGPVEVDGPWLKSCFDFRRTQTIAGIKCFVYDVSAVTHVHGLGYSFVEVREHSIDMETRLWVLATPIDGELIELTAGQPGGAAGQAEAADRRDALPALAPSHPAHEPDHHGRPEAGRHAGRRHLGPKTVSASSAAQPFGRPDRQVPALLRAVLSRRRFGRRGVKPEPAPAGGSSPAATAAAGAPSW